MKSRGKDCRGKHVVCPILRFFQANFHVMHELTHGVSERIYYSAFIPSSYKVFGGGSLRKNGHGHTQVLHRLAPARPSPRRIVHEHEVDHALQFLDI